MGASLDEAERLLVSASWSRASDAAAAARRVARTRDERVAAECVWVQAEYKLGRLGASHVTDARRAAGTGGDPFAPQTLLLWARLRLADPASEPDVALTAAERALLDIFPTADDEDDAPRPARGVESTPSGPSRSSPGGSRAAEGVDDETLSAAAWVYVTRVLCEGRDRPEAAAAWLAERWRDVPSHARERLAEDVAAAARAKSKSAPGTGTPGTGMDASGPAGTSRGTGTPGTGMDASGPAGTSRETGKRASASGSPSSEPRDGDSRVPGDGVGTPSPSPGTRIPSAAREAYDALASRVVSTANDAFGGGWDPGDATTRAAAVAVTAGGCVLAVAAAREAHRRRKWVWGRLEELARWI